MCKNCCCYDDEEFQLFDAVQDAIDAVPTEDDGHKGTCNVVMAIARALGSEASDSLVPKDVEELESIFEMWYNSEDAINAVLDLLEGVGTLGEFSDDVCFLLEETNNHDEIVVLSTMLDLLLVGVYYNVYKESHGIGQTELMNAIRSAHVIN